MKRFFKLWCMCVVFVLAVSTISACQSKGGEKKDGAKGTTSVNEGKTESISVEWLTIGLGSSTEEYYMKKIFKEKFNIDVEFVISSSQNQQHLEKLNLLIASNNLPDIVSQFPNSASPTAKIVGAKGALAAFNKYKDKMPNMFKLLEENKIAYYSALAEDGNLYAAPLISEKIEYRAVPFMRVDLLEELNLKEPETFEDLYQILKAIKAKYPQSIGIIEHNKVDFLQSYGLFFNTSKEVFYDTQLDKWVFGPSNEGYKEMITYFNKLWKEGLMDKELFTAANKQWQEKMLSGNAVFSLTWPSWSVEYEMSYKKLHPDSKFNLRPLMPMTTKSFTKKVIQGVPKVSDYTSVVVSNRSKHVDRIVGMIDYLYTREGATDARWGEKDVHYKEEGGRNKFVENLKAPYNPNAKIDPREQFGLNLDQIMRLKPDNEIIVDNEYTKDVNEVLKRYNDGNYYYVRNNGINLTFDEVQQDQINSLMADLRTKVDEWSINLIVGERPLSDYNKFIDELEKLGGKKLESIYNEAYQKFKQKIK